MRLRVLGLSGGRYCRYKSDGRSATAGQPVPSPLLLLFRLSPPAGSSVARRRPLTLFFLRCVMTLKRPWFTKPFVKGAPPRRASVIARECTSAGIVAYDLLFSLPFLSSFSFSLSLSPFASAYLAGHLLRSRPLFSTTALFLVFLIPTCGRRERERRRRRLDGRVEGREGRDNRR